MTACPFCYGTGVLRETESERPEVETTPDSRCADGFQRHKWNDELTACVRCSIPTPPHVRWNLRAKRAYDLRQKLK